MLARVKHHCRPSKGGRGHGDSGSGQSEDDTTERADRSMTELTSGSRGGNMCSLELGESLRRLAKLGRARVMFPDMVWQRFCRGKTSRLNLTCHMSLQEFAHMLVGHLNGVNRSGDSVKAPKQW